MVGVDDGVEVEVGGGIKGIRWVRSRPLENTVRQKAEKVRYLDYLVMYSIFAVCSGFFKCNFN